MRRLAWIAVLYSFCALSSAAEPRARDLGIPFEGTPGPLNALTDVAGITVGQVTLIEDLADAHKVRTGVTAILPRGRPRPSRTAGAQARPQPLAVSGPISVLISVTLSAGKPPSRAWRRTMSALSASWTQ